jgi:hypothetical protein
VLEIGVKCLLTVLQSCIIFMRKEKIMRYSPISLACTVPYVLNSVAEPHHFYAAPDKNFDAAPAPTLLYTKAKFFK